MTLTFVTTNSSPKRNGRPIAGQLAQHGAGHQARAAGVVVIEQPADQLAGREQAGDGAAVGALDLALVGDLQPAEGEGDAAGHGVGLERRRVDRVGPVALGDGEAAHAAAVLDGGIERHLGHHRGVALLDGLEELLLVDAFELLRQLLDRVGAHLGHALDAVFVAQHVEHLRVEDLPGELLRLGQDHRAVLGVGVVAEVGALVDEALAVGVDHDAERVGVLLEIVADLEVAELGRVHVPADGVPARPVAVRLGADRQRHVDAGAGVEARAAHLGEVPGRTEIARAHLGVALEAAAGQHHGLGADFHLASLVPGDDAAHHAVLLDQRHRGRRVVDRDAGLHRRLVLEVDQARAAAPGLDGEPAPELVLAVDLEGLPAVARLEAHALGPHPLQGLEAAADQDVGQLGVAAVVGHPAHVVEELVGRVAAEIDVALLVLREVVELHQVVDAVEDHPHGARRVGAVAAAFLFGGGLQHGDRGAFFARRQGGTGGRVARAHHQDIDLEIVHVPLLDFGIKFALEYRYG